MGILTTEELLALEPRPGDRLSALSAREAGIAMIGLTGALPQALHRVQELGGGTAEDIRAVEILTSAMTVLSRILIPLCKEQTLGGGPN